MWAKFATNEMHFRRTTGRSGKIRITNIQKTLKLITKLCLIYHLFLYIFLSEEKKRRILEKENKGDGIFYEVVFKKFELFSL